LDKKLWKMAKNWSFFKEASKKIGGGGSFISGEIFGRQEASRGVGKGDV
jgi:hypothetical protein